MTQSDHSRRKKLWFSAIAGVLCVSIALIGGELLTRLLWKDKPVAANDERTLSYRYDAELGWFPQTNSTIEFDGGRLVHIHNNDNGFRDKPPGPKLKQRIAFIGDSFVWGYNVEQEERFTDKLQALLPEWEVMNLGVSGYGTDQEFILLRQWFDRYQPDIVVLVFSDNDVEENMLNLAHGGYYKPYFEEADHQLIQKGVPVPKGIRYYRSEHPLLCKSQLFQWVLAAWLNRTAPKHILANNPTLRLVLQTKHYVESKRAKFLLGYVTEIEGPKKRAFCEAAKIDYLFLLDSRFLTWEYVEKIGGHHWTPKGHDQVCSNLHEFLTAHNFIHKPGASVQPASR